MGMAFRYTPMVMFTLEILRRIRSTAWVSSIGSVCRLPLKKMHSTFSITMDAGGEACLMVMEVTRNQTGIFMMANLKMD